MSSDKHEPETFHIIVNARPREVKGNAISYRQVVSLAFPDAEFEKFDYTVQYTGPHVRDGSLVDGKEVPLHNGLKFDVTRTNKS
jgi:multiubiquitin